MLLPAHPVKVNTGRFELIVIPQFSIAMLVSFDTPQFVERRRRLPSPRRLIDNHRRLVRRSWSNIGHYEQSLWSSTRNGVGTQLLTTDHGIRLFKGRFDSGWNCKIKAAIAISIKFKPSTWDARCSDSAQYGRLNRVSIWKRLVLALNPIDIFLKSGHNNIQTLSARKRMNVIVNVESP